MEVAEGVCVKQRYHSPHPFFEGGGSLFLNTDNESEEGIIKNSVRRKWVVPSVKKDIKDRDQSCYIGESMHNVADLHIHMCNSVLCH